MRRTVLSAMALACTAVLAGTAPAFADGATPASTNRPAPAAAPTRVPAPSAAPTRVPARPVPTRVLARPVPARVPAPSAAPTRVPARPVPTRVSPREVAVVPKGAPDTGVALEPAQSGGEGELIGAGAVAVFAVGGAAFFLVRRRRVTGA